MDDTCTAPRKTLGQSFNDSVNFVKNTAILTTCVAAPYAVVAQEPPSWEVLLFFGLQGGGLCLGAFVLCMGMSGVVMLSHGSKPDYEEIKQGVDNRATRLAFRSACVISLALSAWAGFTQTDVEGFRETLRTPSASSQPTSYEP